MHAQVVTKPPLATSGQLTTVTIRNAETLLTFRKLPKSHLFDLAARLPVDELAMVSLEVVDRVSETQLQVSENDHVKDLCASELGPLRI